MMFNFDSGNPLMGGFGLIGMVFYAIFMLVVVAVSVGLTIIVVRYLLITTKAAQLYIVKNSPAKPAPAAPAAPAAPEAPEAPAARKTTTVATPAAAPATATTATTATKPRTPKAPPKA